MRRELLARLALMIILLGIPMAIFGAEYYLRDAQASHRIITIRASVPQEGGFSQDAVRVAVGEEITLRFTAMDVTHGIAIGPGTGFDLGHIDPGQTKEMTVRFDHLGTYTYYCTTWCSADHWRMRGVITVYDPANPDQLGTPWQDSVIANVYASGINIDARAMGDLPPSNALGGYLPSVARGAMLSQTLIIPSDLENVDWQRTHTPLEALERLSSLNPDTVRPNLVDTVAYLWVEDISASDNTFAESYYNSNCAACHGQQGDGQGPAASTTAVQPVAFNDPEYMFSMRQDVLYAKLRRGGMGTDMPNFGTLLTPDETWRLVNYLETLAFKD